MKIAIKNIYIVNTMQDLGGLNDVVNQTIRYVLDEGKFYMNFTNLKGYYCDSCKKKIGCNSGHWIRDYSVWRTLLEPVADDYDFETDNKTDITNKCDSNMIEYIISNP